jgi:hypothetical protein
MTREVIRLVKNKSLTDFQTKTSSNNIKYVTMKEADEPETIKDVRLIFNKFGIAEYGKYIRKDKLATKLANITFKY